MSTILSTSVNGFSDVPAVVSRLWDDATSLQHFQQLLTENLVDFTVGADSDGIAHVEVMWESADGGFVGSVLFYEDSDKSFGATE